MTIQSVQYNIDNTKSNYSSNSKKRVVKPYLEAKGAIVTDDLVKPLPPKGHLIKNDLKSGVKYFFNDIAYDMKSIKNGFNGTANDHQLGRLNDIGLKTAGIGIATYLASITNNPKARVMEYVGLGAFLTAMDLYPKLAIYAPAKMRHGFNVGKEYIDDQDRKKSVLQDGNYVPFDMFRGETKDEDLSLIADEMGIPKDAKNRNEIAKEHIRKTAIQNQTLWMMTAGVTPALAALMCCGLENYVVGPALESQRNSKYNKMISDMLKRTEEMSLELSDDYSNALSKKVQKLIDSYKGKNIPEEEYKELLRILKEGLDNEAATGLEADIKKLLLKVEKGSTSFVIDNTSMETSIEAMRKHLGARQRDKFEKVLIPTKEEFAGLISKISKDANLEEGVTLTKDQLELFKKSLRELINKKIKDSGNSNSSFFNDILSKMTDSANVELEKVRSYHLSDDVYKKLMDYTKVIGDFKEITSKLNKCQSFKFEYTEETVLARAYAKFEKKFIKELGFTTQEMKIMRESEEVAAKLIDQKLTELAKDDAKYKSVLSKLNEVIVELETSLHGKDANKSAIKDLITAYENIYNKTAQRLDKISAGDFKASIKKLVGQDVDTLKTSLADVNDLYAWLDGVNVSLVKDLDDEMAKLAHEDWNDPRRYALREKYAIESSKGAGSSKKIVLDRIRARYSGVRNSFNRAIQVLDLFKRSLDPAVLTKGVDILSNDPKYVNEIIRQGKKAVLRGSTADFILKFETTNNSRLYHDIINTVYSNVSGLNELGNMSEITKETLSNSKESVGGSVLERYGKVLTKIRNLFGADTTDYTKPRHILDEIIKFQYHKDNLTSESKFNSLAKSPLDMIREGSDRLYGSKKWLKIVSGIAGSVLGVAILSQFAFGKIRHPNKIQKQVNDESN